MGRRRIYKWVAVLTCSNEKQLEEYLDKLKLWKKNKSQPEVCTVCDTNVDLHVMRYRLFTCADTSCMEAPSGLKCKWVMKVLQCTLTEATVVYQDSSHISAAPPSRVPHELNCAMKRYVKERARAGDKPAHIMNTMVFELGLPEGIEKRKLLSRVQSLVRSYRKKNLLDNDFIDVMVAEASRHRFREDLPECAGFVFGFDVDERGDPILGEGTAEDPLVIGFTTKVLMKRLNLCAKYILHVDATFKLNSKGFPVGVLGVSDMWRQFHPVAFYLMSDLKKPQWTSAFRATFEMFRVIAGTTLNVKLVMMDADDAQRGALEHVICEMFPAAGPPTFLMCFFHVMTNVRKHTLKFSNHAKQLIFRHVYRIHYARTETDKDDRIAEGLSAWEMDSECKGFASYFKTQWLGDRYSKWQCLETTTGMAKTNNPVENFNRQLKNQHSLRRLLRLNPLFAELLKVSRIWSVLKVEFAVSPRAAPHIVRDYRKLSSAHKLQITRVSRGSISFLTGSGEFRVHQGTNDTTSESNSSIPPIDVLNNFNDTRTSGSASADTSADRGLSVPTVHNADHPIEVKLSDVDTENASDAQYEAEEQEVFGWAVDLENGNCTCRTMFKLGCCVHLMAVQDSLGLPFDGSAAPTRRVFADKRRKKKHGRPTEVGHALSLS